MSSLAAVADRSSLVGEPGVGKSRLFWEFAHTHRTTGCLVIEAASVSYGKATTYLPVIELLRGYFQIEPRDDTRRIREKVTGKLLSLDRALEIALPALLALLDVSVEDESWTRLDPPQRRQRSLNAVKRLLLRESHVQPLVVIFEDLHWIDGETQAVLDGLVESLPTARLLLLVNYRPEYHHTWGSKTYYRQVRIDALPSASAEELLEALLGSDPSLRPLKALLLERTEGNPFFLEESVRTLVEMKTLAGKPGAYHLARAPEPLQIPPTAQAILAARIDRLVPEDKRLLQIASVVGKEVPLALLEAIADLPEDELRRRLAHLQTSEFLYGARLFPEVEYTFKHALTHEVTYEGMLQERRRELRARIVVAIETHHQDRITEQIERLAHHAFRGALREKAAHYLRQAGLRAAARAALADARARFEQALGVLEQLPESRSMLEQAFETRLELRSVLTQLGEPRQMLDRLREAETLAERLNDDTRRGWVCAFMLNIQSILGELDEALVTGSRALEIAEALGDFDLRILATGYLEMTFYCRGDYSRGSELRAYDPAALLVGGVSERVSGHYGFGVASSILGNWTWLIMSLAELGRLAEAAERAAQVLRMADATHNLFTIGLAHRSASTLQLIKGDWAKALSLTHRWVQVVREGNLVIQLPTAAAASAWALAQAGATTEALNLIREGEQFLERQVARGILVNRGSTYHFLGRACLLLGRLDEARRLGDRAAESSLSQPGFAAHAFHLLGDVAMHHDRVDADSAEAHYRQALALAEPRGMRPLIAHCHLGLGKLYRRTGKREQAQEHPTTAATMYREMDMRFWLEQAEAELGELK